MTLTTPNTTCTNSPPVTWWLDKNGENPCDMLSNLLRQCHSAWVLGNMPPVPDQPRELCSDVDVEEGLSDPYNSCCCNSVAYSLRQACWSCQWGAPEPVQGNRPTFGEYLQCSDTSLPGLDLDQQPLWTQMTFQPGDTWSYNVAEAAAADPALTAPEPSETATQDQNLLVPLVGALSGLIVVSTASVLLFFLLRSRRRSQYRISKADLNPFDLGLESPSVSSTNSTPVRIPTPAAALVIPNVRETRVTTHVSAPPAYDLLNSEAPPVSVGRPPETSKRGPRVR